MIDGKFMRSFKITSRSNNQIMKSKDKKNYDQGNIIFALAKKNLDFERKSAWRKIKRHEHVMPKNMPN